MPDQEIGKGKPGPGRGKKAGANGTGFPGRGSNNAAYLAGRLKRDAPGGVVEHATPTHGLFEIAAAIRELAAAIESLGASQVGDGGGL